MAAIEPRAKIDRDEVFLEYTKSVCPVCKAVIDAEVNVRDNRVILRKRCPEHGLFEALVYSDAQLYLAQQRFNKPGTIPLEFQTEVVDGCPLDCGLCAEHKQHACLGIIEVNTGCNLDCPICFADSGHQPDGYSLTLEQVDFMLDRFVAAEGSPEVVQFSGGEPTIHPYILAFSGGIQVDGSLTLSNSTVDHNQVNASIPSSSGSTAIAAQGGLGVGGVATIRNSLIKGNSVTAASTIGVAELGGAGIGNFGQLTLERTLVIGNTATANGAAGFAEGGGINNFTLGGPPPQLTLIESVITANRLNATPGITAQGGGLFTSFPVTLTRTVIAGNKPDQCFGC